MKRFLSVILSIILCLSCNIVAFAQEDSEAAQSNSQPRLMVSSFKLDTNTLSPNKSSILSLTFKNFSTKKAVSNIRLSVADESAEIKINGTNSVYVEKISANSAYVWNVSMSVSAKAMNGSHKLSVSAEYEDEDGNAYSCADIVSVDVTGAKDSEGEEQTTELPASASRLMVSSYSLNTKALTSAEAKLSVVIKNQSKKDYVKNIKLSISDDSGEIIIPSSSKYVDKIKANSQYVWDISVKAGKDARSGYHKLSLAIEYEDSKNNPLTSADSVSVNVKGVKAEEETTESQNTSAPRLMVTSYSVDGDYISPSGSTTARITLKNCNSKKAVSNIKLSVTNESDEVKPVNTGTLYIEKLGANQSYTWELELTASKKAAVGEHKLVVNSEYEDQYYAAFSAADTIIVNVRQTVSLDYDGIILPKRVYQEDTVSTEFYLINTGKTEIRNAKLDFDIEGLDSGGVVFVGEVPVGESVSKNANLRVSSELLGDISGVVVLSYEDELGKEYSETIHISSKIEKKKAVSTNDEKKKEKKNSLWWVFLLVGVIAGGAAGFAIPTAVHSKKQRKEDELRL